MLRPLGGAGLIGAGLGRQLGTLNNRAANGDFETDLTGWTVSSWYNSSWLYRVKITVENTKVLENITNFPVFVDLSLLPTGFHTHVNQTDARDIRVTTADGTTEVPREIVWYDAATDTGELHFKATTLSSSTDTDFYIYYGNNSASDYAVTNTYGRNNVWDSNFKGVWHMNDATTSTIGDSTSNGNTGTKKGANEPVQVNGKIGKGQIFTDTDDYITVNTGLAYDRDTVTYSIFANALSGNGYVFLGVKDDLSDSQGSLDFGSSGIIRTTIWESDNRRLGTFVFTNGVWYRCVVVVNQSNDTRYLYVNGELNAQDNYTGNGGYPYTKLRIGNNINGNSPFPGILDEFRISNIARSANWIATENNNLAANSTWWASIAIEEGHTRDTDTKYSGTASAKIVTSGISTSFTQSLNVGDTSAYTLYAYAYTTGAAVTDADVQLYYNGAAVTTTYTSVGSGWYLLSATVTGANAVRTWGVEVKAGKTVYIDNFGIY